MRSISGLTFLVIFFTLILGQGGFSQDTAPGLGSEEQQQQPAPTVREDASPGEMAELQFGFGYNAFLDGDLAEAFNRFKRAVNHDSTHIKSRYWFGKMLYKRGYDTRALKNWNRVDTGYYERLADYQVKAHQIRTREDPTGFPVEWDFSGAVDLAAFDRPRNLNPSALEPRPRSGWYGLSYRRGVLFEYNDAGEPVRSYEGLQKPKDVIRHPTRGLLVVELARDRLVQVTPEGLNVLVEEGLSGPSRLILVGKKLVIFNSGSGELVHLTSDTGIAPVWAPEPRWRMVHAIHGPNGNFWLYEARNHQLFEISPDGELLNRHDLPDRNIHNMWSIEGRMVIAWDDQIGIYDFESQEFKPFNFRDRKPEVRDISDILKTGGRLVVARTGESLFEIFRRHPTPEPDVLVHIGRTDFRDWPLVRLNMSFEDPLDGRRFRGLNDNNVGIEIDERQALPSLARPRSDIYHPSFVVLFDPYMGSAKFEESRELIRGIINKKPENSAGVLMEVSDEPFRTGFTRSSASMRRELRAMNYRETGGDTDQLLNVMEQAFDALLRRRGSTGLILVSQRFKDHPEMFGRMARRARNMQNPVTMAVPTSEAIPDTHPMIRVGEANLLTFNNYNPGEHWKYFREQSASDYAVIFRSPKRILRSGYAEQFTFLLSYLGRGYEVPGVYIHP